MKIEYDTFPHFVFFHNIRGYKIRINYRLMYQNNILNSNSVLKEDNAFKSVLFLRNLYVHKAKLKIQIMFYLNLYYQNLFFK